MYPTHYSHILRTEEPPATIAIFLIIDHNPATLDLEVPDWAESTRVLPVMALASNLVKVNVVGPLGIVVAHVLYVLRYHHPSSSRWKQFAVVGQLDACSETTVVVAAWRQSVHVEKCIRKGQVDVGPVLAPRSQVLPKDVVLTPVHQEQGNVGVKDVGLLLLKDDSLLTR